MSAGKLSRYTGLVFVLAAFFAGASAADLNVEYGTGGSSTAMIIDGAKALAPAYSDSAATPVSAYDYDWH